MKSEGSRKARRTAARLAAVQGVYEMLLSSDRTARAIVGDFTQSPPGDGMADGHRLVTPDPELMSAIIGGVDERREDLRQLITGVLTSSGGRTTEPLLQSVLMCGAYELLAHHETDVALIIADYLDVTHAFFDQGESKLVNGVLDRIAKNVRDPA